MTRPEAVAAFLRDLLTAGSRLRHSLREAQEAVAAEMPLSSDGIERLPAPMKLAIDAFLLRFANLTMLVHGPLLRAVLLAENETLEGRSRRDALNLAAKLGAFPADVDPNAILAARHRLAHVYPNDPGRQAGLVNQVFEAAPMLVSMFDGLAAHVAARGLAEE